MFRMHVRYIAADYDMDGSWSFDFLIDDNDRAIEVFYSVTAVEQHIEKMKEIYAKIYCDSYEKFTHACQFAEDSEGDNYMVIYSLSKNEIQHIEPIGHTEIIHGTYKGETYSYEIY